MRLLLCSLTLALMTICPGTLAQEQTPDEKPHPLDIEHQKCVDADGSTAGMHQCLDQILPKWDALLNKYYLQLGGDKNAALRQAQLAWIKYRDGETAWVNKKYEWIYDKAGGGTMWPLLAHSELVEITRQRALKLMRDFELIRENTNFD